MVQKRNTPVRALWPESRITTLAIPRPIMRRLWVRLEVWRAGTTKQGNDGHRAVVPFPGARVVVYPMPHRPTPTPSNVAEHHVPGRPALPLNRGPNPGRGSVSIHATRRTSAAVRDSRTPDARGDTIALVRSGQSDGRREARKGFVMSLLPHSLQSYCSLKHFKELRARFHADEGERHPADLPSKPAPADSSDWLAAAALFAIIGGGGALLLADWSVVVAVGSACVSAAAGVLFAEG